eukprot:gnl/MRDRNA2_/MRDRNA2_27236_c0_seq1.p2 gnl/MRDRNA2_/MRDRNA2_27236_c0~~gnl/MRDRNA2_/MRDRNA2_27236_c0_seq1.p2  ORF type:complete len:346 (+),score=76.72 gnl/MRDRNA2_/MRDRNA2_27236_c0_seq1:1790-2827(+)
MVSEATPSAAIHQIAAQSEMFQALTRSEADMEIAEQHERLKTFTKLEADMEIRNEVLEDRVNQWEFRTDEATRARDEIEHQLSLLTDHVQHQRPSNDHMQLCRLANLRSGQNTDVFVAALWKIDELEQQRQRDNVAIQQEWDRMYEEYQESLAVCLGEHSSELDHQIAWSMILRDEVEELRAEKSVEEAQMHMIDNLPIGIIAQKREARTRQDQRRAQSRAEAEAGELPRREAEAEASSSRAPVAKKQSQTIPAWVAELREKANERGEQTAEKFKEVSYSTLKTWRSKVVKQSHGANENTIQDKILDEMLPTFNAAMSLRNKKRIIHGTGGSRPEIVPIPDDADP